MIANATNAGALLEQSQSKGGKVECKCRRKTGQWTGCMKENEMIQICKIIEKCSDEKEYFINDVNHYPFFLHEPELILAFLSLFLCFQMCLFFLQTQQNAGMDSERGNILVKYVQFA